MINFSIDPESECIMDMADHDETLEAAKRFDIACQVLDKHPDFYDYDEVGEFLAEGDHEL